MDQLLPRSELLLFGEGTGFPLERVNRIHPATVRGIASVFTGRAKNRRAACHVRDATNVSRQKRTQRRTVRSLTCKRSRSLRIRAGVTPPCRIGTSNTTTAKKTFRPRNRSDGGVNRRRQPSVAQQKLNRRFISGPSESGPPRGLRGYRAACSTPSHSQPAARASAASSASHLSSIS